MEFDLRQSWKIGAVEIPSRLALAPMAGVSVQAYRRQARRFGAGLVWSEMVSAAGLEHGSRRTRDYLRVGPGEHPIALQIFGSEPTQAAEAARMAEAAGADIVDLNLGCPVRKVMKSGAGAALLEQPELACRIVEEMAAAVSIPVTVKLRRGIGPGSRTCIELGPRLAAAGAQALVLHPRAQRQMYGGSADHSLTAELASLLEIPVVASGDVRSGEQARVLIAAGAAAVMIGRAAQGNPWLLSEILSGEETEPSQAEVAAELVRFMREVACELGEKRAQSFLRKFYGWYLRRGRFPRQLRRELVAAESLPAAEALLFSAAPGAERLAAKLDATGSDGVRATAEAPPDRRKG
ncbi:MAG TPA: tRNA-dihydrouridine synthase [Gaiellaceae bacterium]|jgi:tRNA-dihydrouridine synthase B